MVIGGALLRVGEDTVSLGSLFKLLFGFVIIGVSVWMVLERQLAVGALQDLVVCILTDA
jgi:hypothetical protein